MGSRLPGEGQKGRQPTAPLVTKGAGRGGISGLVGSVPGERLSAGASPGAAGRAWTAERLVQPPKGRLAGRAGLGPTPCWVHSGLAPHCLGGCGPSDRPRSSPRALRSHLGLQQGGECPAQRGQVRGPSPSAPLSSSQSAQRTEARGTAAAHPVEVGTGWPLRLAGPTLSEGDPRAKETPLLAVAVGSGCPREHTGCRTQVGPSLRPGAGTPPVPLAPITISACSALGSTQGAESPRRGGALVARGSACLAGSAGTKSPGLPGAARPLACRHERRKQASCHSQAAPTRSSTGGCPGRGLGTCCPGLGQGASPSSHTQGAGSKAICWAGWPTPCPCPAGSPGSSRRGPAVHTLLSHLEEATSPCPPQASSAGPPCSRDRGRARGRRGQLSAKSHQRGRQSAGGVAPDTGPLSSTRPPPQLRPRAPPRVQVYTGEPSRSTHSEGVWSEHREARTTAGWHLGCPHPQAEPGRPGSRHGILGLGWESWTPARPLEKTLLLH